MRNLTFILSLALVVLLASQVAAQRKKPDPKAADEKATDRIDRSSGGSIVNVIVVKEDFRVVTYRRKGGKRTLTVPSEMVIDVVRGDTPQNLRDGKSRAVAGDLKNAVGPLQLAVRSSTPWVKEYANFYLGEVQRKLGRHDAAVRAYEAALQAKPDSRFLPRGRIGIAKAWISSKSYGKAEGVLKAFVREVDSKRLSRSFALEGKQILGRSFEAQTKYQDASREYDSVITEARSLGSKAKTEGEKDRFRVIGLRAQRDKGSAYIKAKKYNDAIRIFAQLSSDRKDALARAIGQMGMGEIELSRGNVDKARVELSRVVALGFGADEEVPRALRLLAQTYLELRKKNEKGADKMARMYIEDLLRSYPGSEEAKIARNLQQQLK